MNLDMIDLPGFNVFFKEAHETICRTLSTCPRGLYALNPADCELDR